MTKIELSHIETPQLQQIYANAGYRLLEVDPRSIVIVAWKGVPVERWAKQIAENKREYEMLKRGATSDELSRAGFHESLLQYIRDSPHLIHHSPHALAQIPGTDKYFMLDPDTPHLVFGDILGNRKSVSIIFDGDRPLRQYDICHQRWERYPSCLYDRDVDDATKTQMAKTLIEEFREQHRNGQIVLDFVTLEERIK